MTASPQTPLPGAAAAPAEDGLPISPALRILMGVGFIAVGIVQGVGVLTAEAGLAGTSGLLEGFGFFLLAGTGVTMLMDRAYSLYLLLVWAILGIASSFLGEGSPVLAALFARVMVALVAVVALSQKGSGSRSGGM